MLGTEVRTLGKLLAFSMLVLALLISQGCQSVKRGFSGTEHEEITPFAQKTVEVIAVDNIQLRDDELIFLRQFVDDSFVQLDHLQELLLRTEVFRDKVIIYSIELVRVTEQYDNDADKVAAYADSIDKTLRPPITGYLNVSEQDWENVLADIRAQDDLLGALRAMQPIITRAGEYYDELMAEIEATVLLEVRTEFDRRIQTEFAEAIEFSERHYLYRDELLAALNLVDDYRRGNKDAIAELRSRNYLIDPALLASDSPNRQQTLKLQGAVEQQLMDSTVLLENFEKDIDDYMTVRAELDRKEGEVLADLSLARLQFVTWARAHQALASGVKDPGKWMELSVKAAKLVKNAAF